MFYGLIGPRDRSQGLVPEKRIMDAAVVAPSIEIVGKQPVEPPAGHSYANYVGQSVAADLKPESRRSSPAAMLGLRSRCLTAAVGRAGMFGRAKPNSLDSKCF